MKKIALKEKIDTAVDDFLNNLIELDLTVGQLAETMDYAKDQAKKLKIKN